MSNKTLADILAEMRRHIQAARDYPQDIDITDGDVEDWADRIEAAAAREREMAKGLSKKMDENRAITGNTAALRLCDELIQAAYDADICSPYDLAQRVRKIKDAIGPSPQPGNAAAMRAALIQCELFLGNVSRHAHPTLNPGDKCTACVGVDELRGMVVRALAAPPRNCDRFATVGAAHKAWRATDQERDFADWLFDPEEGDHECES